MHALEISITTTIDHEVGNVLKCLKAGVQNIAIICIEPERLGKIERAICNCVESSERAKIAFYVPDRFLEYLALLSSHSAPARKEVIKGAVKRCMSLQTRPNTSAKSAEIRSPLWTWTTDSMSI